MMMVEAVLHDISERLQRAKGELVSGLENMHWAIEDLKDFMNSEALQDFENTAKQCEVNIALLLNQANSLSQELEIIKTRINQNHDIKLTF